MANSKVLTAKVGLDISSAEAKLKKLHNLITNINKATNGTASQRGVTAAVNKQLRDEEKLQALVNRETEKAIQAVNKKQQAQWKAFQAEQVAYEKQLAKAEQIKQKELERERIRQQSLNTLGQGDKAAQRLAQQAEKLKREEYEAWWQQQLVNQEWQKANPIISKLPPKLQEWIKKQQQVEQEVKDTNTHYSKTGGLLKGITSKLKMLASTYLGVMGTKAMINTSDIITGAQNKLNYLNGGDTDTQASMDKMYNSAKKVRMSYTDMMSNVTKSMTLAGDAFGGNIDNAIRFQEIMAEAYSIGGAQPGEVSSSMYQMVQALGSGTLAGDELRSVREGAPLAYQKIEEFAQGVYNTTESLKDLASQGKITSDMVVAAVLNAGTEMDDAYGKTKVRFEEVWNQIKSAATKAFVPISNMLSDLLDKAVKNDMVKRIEGVFTVISKAIYIAFTLVSKLAEVFVSIYNFIANNWGVISKILLSIAAIIAIALIPKLILWIKYLGMLAVYYLVVGVQALIAGIKALIGWMAANWVLALILIALAAVVVTLIWVSKSFEDACGLIVGSIYWAVSVIWNVFVTLVALIAKQCVLPLFQMWDAFANFFGNLFNDPIASIIHLFESLADSVLSILETIASGIDAIFGSNLAGAVQGWRKGLSSYADSLANKYGNGSYEEKSAAAKQVEDMINGLQNEFTWNSGDAFNSGYDLGYSGGKWVTDKLSSVSNMLGTGYDGLFGSSSALNPNSSEDLLKDIGNISDNTDKISDSMDLTSEDLSYLRKLAELEWKKEYTTANITVDMTNNNNINSDSDIGNIAIKLREVLVEEMDALANGVY